MYLARCKVSQIRVCDGADVCVDAAMSLHLIIYPDVYMFASLHQQHPLFCRVSIHSMYGSIFGTYSNEFWLV